MRNPPRLSSVFAAMAGIAACAGNEITPTAPRRTVNIGGPVTQAEYLAALRKHPNHPYNLLKRYEEYVYANARRLSNVELDGVVGKFLKEHADDRAFGVKVTDVIHAYNRKEKIEWVLEKHTETFKRRWSEENKFEFADIEDPEKFTVYLKSLREKAKPTVQE